MDGFTWLRHRETGGYFHCPNAALDDMAKLGWQPSEAPEIPDPTVAEHLAWRRKQEAARAADVETTKSAPRGESKEMSDG